MAFEGPRLETRPEELETLPPADVIIVLSEELKKGRKTKEDEKDNGGRKDKPKPALSLRSKMRALGGFELLQRGQGKRIIFAGGPSHKFPGEASRAEMMRQYLLDLLTVDVSPDLLHIENLSQNTTQNLENVLDMLGPDVRSVIVATNESHLARARQIFGHMLEKRGLKIQERYAAVEELLQDRSSRYGGLTSRLKRSPKEMISSLREFLRRVLILIDRDDRLATFIAEKVRGGKELQRK